MCVFAGWSQNHSFCESIRRFSENVRARQLCCDCVDLSACSTTLHSLCMCGRRPPRGLQKVAVKEHICGYMVREVSKYGQRHQRVLLWGNDALMKKCAGTHWSGIILQLSMYVMKEVFIPDLCRCSGGRVRHGNVDVRFWYRRRIME